MKQKPSLGVIIRTIIAWILLVLLAIIYNIIAPILGLFASKHTCHKLFHIFSHNYIFIVKHLCNVNYQVEGMENMLKGSVLVASNHQSVWETQAHNMLFPNVVWVLKRELLKIPLFGWALRTLSPIAIDRSRGSEALEQILSQGRQRVKDGFSIIIFPEGTRVPPGQEKPFKTGAAKIAKELDLPIIPVAQNSGRLLPKNTPWMFPGLVRVKIGKPIYPSEYNSYEELNEKLELVVKTMLREIDHV